MLRSPHLVPYNKVDDAIKKANRYYLLILQINLYEIILG